VTTLRIEHFTVAEFGRELAQKAENAHHVWRARSGLLLELGDELGNTGQGEASPLPGYSQDDLATNRAALGALELRGLELALDLSITQLLTVIGSLVPVRASAARFALETALLDLLGHRLHKPAWALLGATLPPSVPLAALLDARDADERLGQADRACARGLRTLKVKLGRTPGELDDLYELRRHVGPQVMIRLDANQAFTVAEAVRILPTLALISPEFLEEPVVGFELAKPRDELWDVSPIPLALDESLQHARADHALRAGGVPRSVRVLVLKPTALGGFARCLGLAELGQRLGLGVVVSHTFEGPVAWAAAACLALAVESPGLAAGLDRHAGLSAWPEVTPATIGQTAIVPASAPGLGLDPVRLA
jgi:o-succinylbenzoate synthase